MINLEEKDAQTVQLNLVGEITGEDYKAIRPRLEALFKQGGRKKFLFNMDPATSFSMDALYQNVKFDLQHFKYVGTTAVVSNKTMAETITKMVDTVYPVKVERFDDVASAYQWLSSQAP